MALLKIKCPECNAGLKSPTGFTVGQTVCCPKCETYFAVEEPEEEEEAPKKSAPAAKGKPAPAKKPVKAAVAEDLPDEDEEEEEEEAPKKKKKKKKKRDDDDDEERSYKNSPLRFVILGILIIVMLVLGYMLYEKKQNEAKQSDAGGSRERPLSRVIPPIPLPGVSS